MPTPTDGPTPQQMSEVMTSPDPIMAMFGMMPDEQLVALAEAIDDEIERRGLG